MGMAERDVRSRVRVVEVIGGAVMVTHYLARRSRETGAIALRPVHHRHHPRRKLG